MRIALDSSVLAYAEGVDDADREIRARRLIRALPGRQVVLPVQVLGELYAVLRRKRRTPPAEARRIVLSWRASYVLAETTSSALAAALDLTAAHGFQVWDAIILSVTAEAGCGLLLSEDMHDGFTWGGVTIANPFADEPHPLLRRVLQTRH